MAERILPGVTVDVRAEGLTTTTVGAVNVIGIVGTANWGPLSTATTVSSLAEAVDYFKTDDTNLTLIKALQLSYGAGASTVRIVRIEDGNADYSALSLLNGTVAAMTITAYYKGTYGDNISVTVTENGSNVDVKITDGVVTEYYINQATNDLIVAAINAQSSLVTAAKLTSSLIDAVTATNLAGGDDGESVTDGDYVTGMTVLEGEDINFLLCAGQESDSLHTSMDTHCQNMANVGKERIAVAGCDLAEDIATIKARSTKSDRFIFICPGVVVLDTLTGADVTRSGAYAASAIAGLLSGYDVQNSITNSTIAGITDVEDAYSDAELKDLLQDNRCPIKKKNGIRVSRGITTSTISAWQQITTRRIVDYVKSGVRNAGDDFIGKLNNERIRSALKGVLDSFLNDLVFNEVLEQYTCAVSATRQEEIAGVCKVAISMQPVFSIDFIECTIYLS